MARQAEGHHTSGANHSGGRRQSVRRKDDRRDNALRAMGEWVAHAQPNPLFLVDGALTPMFLNRAAHRLLMEATWIRINEGGLELRDPALQQQLRDLLAHWPVGRTSTARIGAGERSMRVTPLGSHGGLRRMYVVALVGPGAKAVDFRKLAEEFGLTPAEREVAIAVYRGASRNAIARARHCKLNTIKTQIRSLFRKLGVRSQREVAWRIDEWGANGAE